MDDRNDHDAIAFTLSSDFLKLMAEIHSITEREYTQHRGAWSELVSSLANEIPGVVLGLHRSEFEQRYMFFVNYEALREKRGLPRVTLSCDITSRGNLTVRVEPGFRDESGYYRQPPEWHPARDITMGYGGFTRPPNEILFLHDVETLFRVPNTATEDGWKLRDIASRAVKFAVDVVKTRMRDHFEVNVIHDVVLLQGTDERAKGLKVVDLVERRRDRIRSQVETTDFTSNFGIDRDTFWALCIERERTEGLNSHRSVARSLKKLPNDLSPTEAQCKWAYSLLTKASRERLWQPPDVSSQQSLIDAVFPKSSHVPQPPKEVVPARPAPSLITTEIAEEFSITTVGELVGLVNKARLEMGLPKLAQGSYPTRKGLIQPLVKFLRQRIERTAGPTSP